MTKSISFLSIVLCIMLYLFIPSSIFADGLCPPDTGTNCTDWENSIYQTTTENPDCNLTVYYHWRNCNGNYQIYVDSLIKTGNCDYLNGQSSASTFQDWLNLVLIEEIANLSGQYAPPDCPSTSTKAIFYTASCGLWVKCEYTVDSTSRLCDPDWRGDYPDYSAGGTRKIRFWKWQSCGITCCKKTYSICKTLNATSTGYTIHINSVSKQKIGNCTNPDNFVQPCQDGC
jgi:hypothetical protein